MYVRPCPSCIVYTLVVELERSSHKRFYLALTHCFMREKRTSGRMVFGGGGGAGFSFFYDGNDREGEKYTQLHSSIWWGKKWPWNLNVICREQVFFSFIHEWQQNVGDKLLKMSFPPWWLFIGYRVVQLYLSSAARALSIGSWFEEDIFRCLGGV